MISFSTNLSPLSLLSPYYKTNTVYLWQHIQCVWTQITNLKKFGFPYFFSWYHHHYHYHSCIFFRMLHVLTPTHPTSTIPFLLHMKEVNNNCSTGYHNSGHILNWLWVVRSLSHSLPIHVSLSFPHIKGINVFVMITLLYLSILLCVKLKKIIIVIHFYLIATKLTPLYCFPHSHNTAKCDGPIR